MLSYGLVAVATQVQVLKFRTASGFAQSNVKFKITHASFPLLIRKCATTSPVFRQHVLSVCMGLNVYNAVCNHTRVSGLLRRIRLRTRAFELQGRALHVSEVK